MSDVIDTAVIMAGGQGMRLRPYTTVLPKPLMPLGDYSLLEILVRQLRAAGVRRVILSVHHLAHLLRAVMDHASPAGLEVEYQHEDRPLGTCGALALMRERLPEHFLVVNGDLLSDYPIGRLLERHHAAGAAMTIATRQLRQVVSCGVIERDADGTMVGYVEKPAHEYEASIGLYAMSRRCTDPSLLAGTPADIPTLANRLLALGERVEAAAEECEWIDIGQPDDYQRAQDLFERDNGRFFRL